MGDNIHKNHSANSVNNSTSIQPTTKILVIEDERNIRETLQDILELKGYEVIVAADGKTGFEQALLHCPDLIICDVMMPGMDGWAVIDKIRTTKSPIVNTPFLFLTAKVDKTDFRTGMNLGADDYLFKPVSNQDLFNAIETRLSRKQATKEEIKKKVQEVQAQINYVSPHEFNTPLNGIMGSLEVMQMLVDNGKELSKQDIEGMLKIIRISGNRLRKTLSNNSLFNFITNLEHEPKRRKALATGSTPDCESLIKRVATTNALGHKRESDLSINIEPSTVGISSPNLEKVIDELVDNAFKFSTPGKKVDINGILIGERYKITISDSGRGMSEDEISEIGPFRQFNRHIYEQQGMGIGLFLAKSLVELNRGTFEVTSSKSNGTKIEIILPTE